MKNSMILNWRTTIFGAGGIGYLIFEAVAKLLDGNPSTNPDWPVLIAAVMPCIGLLFTRDAKVSSEDMGIKGGQL